MFNSILAPLNSLIDRYRRSPHIGLVVYVGVSIPLLFVLPNLPHHLSDWEWTYAPAALDWLRGVREPWLQHPNFANPPFVLLLILPVAVLGVDTSFIVYLVLMIVGLYFAARQLGGAPVWLILSYPGVWMLAYGQFEPLVCVGVAMGWHALRQQKYWLLNVAYLLLAIKPQIGLAPAVLYFFWTPTWRARLQSCWLPVGVISWTFLNWGLWPVDFVRRVAEVDKGLTASIGVSLWPMIGPLALALFIPAVFTKANRRTRLLLVLAANALASPYSPAYSMLPMLAFPLPWWGYVAASLPAIEPDAGIFSRGAALLPLGLLLYRSAIRAPE